MRGRRSDKRARPWFVTLEISRSTAGHGFQSSTIVLTNLGNEPFERNRIHFTERIDMQ